MSATSGIPISPSLASTFAGAVEEKSTRFIKVSIKDESLVHDLSLPAKNSFREDLLALQENSILEESMPAYVLAKLDTSGDWLAIYYVPDAASVRDKMLYAASRPSLLKSLGSALFVDSIFATSKADITPEAYVSHLRHLNAPLPLSDREQQIANLRAAENTTASYQGSRARVNHIGSGVGLNWSTEAEEAVAELGNGDNCTIVIVQIDTASETLVLHSVSNISAETVGSTLPQSEPCYAFFAWPHSYSTSPRREIVFIYSCPSSSPIKHRMIYSSGSTSTFQTAKSLLESSCPSISIASRKVETSDPKEVRESWLKAELMLENSNDSTSTPEPQGEEKKPFAKPRGPGRRR